MIYTGAIRVLAMISATAHGVEMTSSA